VPVSYESDLTLRIEKVINAINENTRIVVLLNPNNPIGNVYSNEEFEAVRKRAEEVGALVIVDEAYHYFYSKSFLKEALVAPNVVVLRTFSKLMSLAAVRLGVIIGNSELIGYVRNARLTFDANSVALLFAERLMDRPDVIDSLIRTQQEGKDWLLAELDKMGYWCRDCMGNFIFLKTRHDAHEVSDRLAKMNVLVHPYGNPLLKDFIRVSTGSKAAMGRFLKAFKEADK
jgi:histidinol-phosphate aminotransferase